MIKTNKELEENRQRVKFELEGRNKIRWHNGNICMKVKVQGRDVDVYAFA